MSERIFKHSDFLEAADTEPLRSEITTSKDASISSWIVKPGQSISLHMHPHGQDTWIVQSGIGQYTLDAQGTVKTIIEGDVVVAKAGEIHGVVNNGSQALTFISVLSPPDAGLELINTKD
jgi:quercetin dioxygenase-like cupin family protein